MSDHPLVEARNLTVTYRRGRETLSAVSDVSFDIKRGSTVGLVGESGSGKSSIGSVLLGLVTPSAGAVRFDGTTISRSTRHDRAALARRIQAVFQDPFGSMNPTRRIGATLAEPLVQNLRLDRPEVDRRLESTLAEVGIDRSALDRYPGQFSGGQLQRLAIARALVMEPDFIVCDEAVSSLDLSVQAQVINLFSHLARKRGLSYLFISHDLPVVAHVSDEILVLFAGRVVEHGPAEAISQRPAHPYTQNLVLSAPVPDPAVQAERRRVRQRASASPLAAPCDTPGRQAATIDPSKLKGCPYALRCPFAVEPCRVERPALIRRSDGTSVACHRYDELSALRREIECSNAG